MLFSALDEKSSSDDENENYDNVMFTPEDEEVQNLAVIPGEFVFHRFGGNVDDLVDSSNDSESCSSNGGGECGGGDNDNDNSSDESDESYNHSDSEDKFSLSSNKSMASNAETADTTHSYSNSLLEDEEEGDNNGGAVTDNSDFETDEQYEDAHLLLPNVKIEQTPNLSDFNNGMLKRWSF